MRYVFCFLFLLNCLAGSLAQESAAIIQADSSFLQFAVPIQVVTAAADHLSNVYVITTGNSIEKYDSTGLRVARYTNNRLGKAYHLDVSNPMKILLWYADFQTIVTLDRTLNEVGVLPLSDAGFPTVRSIAQAQDGNIWIYDDAGFRLMKISSSGTIIQESQPLNMVFKERFSATCIRDNGEMVFVSDPQRGIIAFDQYGYLLRTYPDLKTARFDVIQNWLVFPDKGVLRFEQLSRFQSIEVHLPAAAALADAQVWASGTYFFIQTVKGLEVYRTGK